MITRSENFLKTYEGFKLGSLGAGKKPGRDLESEQPEEGKLKITVIDQPENDAVVAGKSVNFPSIVWEESDGFAYDLSVNHGALTGTFTMILLAGKRVGFAGISTDWLAMSISAPEFGPIIEKYRSYVSEIKTSGIETLAPDGRLLSSFKIQPNYRAGYQKWYAAKEKE